METRRRHPLPLFALAFVLLACAGIHARETVLMPTMSQAWSTVISKHVELAATAMPEEEANVIREKNAAMQAALDSGDRYQVRGADWLALRVAATAGIASRVASGEIGPGVADSIRETLNQFDADFVKLGAR